MTNDRQDGGSGVDEALYIACSRNKIQMSIYIYIIPRYSTLIYMHIVLWSTIVYSIMSIKCHC